MIITGVSMENFLCVKERVHIELKPITLLFGANSAGKTTVIKALQYLSEIFEFGNLDPVSSSVAADQSDLGGFRTLVHNHDLSLPLTVGLTLDLSSSGCFDINSEVRTAVYGEQCSWQGILLHNLGEKFKIVRSEPLPWEAFEPEWNSSNFRQEVRGKANRYVNDFQIVHISVTVRWDSATNSPLIDRYQLDLDNDNVIIWEWYSRENGSAFLTSNGGTQDWEPKDVLSRLCYSQQSKIDDRRGIRFSGVHNLFPIDNILESELDDLLGYKSSDDVEVTGRRVFVEADVNRMIEDAKQILTEGSWADALGLRRSCERFLRWIDVSGTRKVLDVMNWQPGEGKRLDITDAPDGGILDYLTWSNFEQTRELALQRTHPEKLVSMSLGVLEEKEIKILENQIKLLLIWPARCAKNALSRFRYLGPLRVRPGRDALTSASPNRRDWTTGLSSYKVLADMTVPDPGSASETALRTLAHLRRTKFASAGLEELNSWLHDRLESGYRIVVEKSHPLDSGIVAKLKEEQALSDADRTAISRLRTEERVYLTRDDGLEVEFVDVGVGLSQLFPVLIAPIAPADPRDTKKPYASALERDLVLTQAISMFEAVKAVLSELLPEGEEVDVVTLNEDAYKRFESDITKEEYMKVLNDLRSWQDRVLDTLAWTESALCSIIAIEQPELHLHPALQVKLGDYFIWCKDYAPCVLLETHSEHLLLRMLRRIRETTEDRLPEHAAPVTPADLAVYFVQKRVVDGTSEFREIHVAPDGVFADPWPGGFFDERLAEFE